MKNDFQQSYLSLIHLNSGERIPCWLCYGTREQNNKKVIRGSEFLASSAARSFNATRENASLVSFQHQFIYNRRLIAYLGNMPP